MKKKRKASCLLERQKVPLFCLRVELPGDNPNLPKKP
jgi:hypothetical protein